MPELADQYVLLSRTFDPAISPRLAEMLLASDAMLECRLELWGPILKDYDAAGLLAEGVDIAKAIRWLLYQSIWFLSHPESLTESRAERRRYIDTYIFGAIVASPPNPRR